MDIEMKEFDILKIENGNMIILSDQASHSLKLRKDFITHFFHKQLLLIS